MLISFRVVNLHPSERISAGIVPFGAPKIGDGGKNSLAGTSGRGTGKLPPHIPRSVDIPNFI
ncbi:hypothetical protein A2U01_0071573 [Trifolium medium]|uniref:Uncharacterized protein n=1 Tax=Trifolium medium TaxID=97028 RepID=A0A392SNT2_9FABA|nr:hypothetical protein [Trifolium medium]